jgi:hypothetical protein
MATVLTTQTLVDSNRRAVVKFVGTGGNDSNTLLLVSNLAYALNTNGQIMTGGVDKRNVYKHTIKRIWGQGQMTQGKQVILKWGGNNDYIVSFGDGHFDYNFDREGLSASIPLSGDTSGDIVYTSTAGDSDTWTLFIDLKKDGTDFDQGQTADPAAFNWYDFQGNPKS